MRSAYTITNQQGQYFITCTVHQWANVFTRKEYIDISSESIRFCQSTKGLQVYAWVLMSNHIHIIVGTNKDSLSDIIRDFKKYTSKKIFEAIKIIR